MSVEQFQGLVAEISARTGVADLAADADGYLALSFDDHVLHLQYEPDDDVVALFTRLPEVEEVRAEQIYLMLLSANLFWQGTGGGTFAVEPATGAVFLMDRRAFAGLRADDAVAWLERFRAMVGHWVERLETANRGGPIDVLDPDAPQDRAAEPETGLPESFIRV